MKILHCCLAAFYIDDYGYQENILPKMHRLQGHQVSILASTETYINTKLDYVKPSSYINSDGIPIIRLPYIKVIPSFLSRKLRIYKGLKSVLFSIKPDIIFIHDLQFLSILTIANYAKKNKHVLIYVDGHTDFINSAKNWISRNILHRIVYRYCAKIISPFTTKFYGVLPLRIDFMKDVYKIDKSMIEFLPLGYDDTVVNFANRENMRSQKRRELLINDKDFLIVSGGKIDLRKNLHILLQAFKILHNDNVKLLIFGKPTLEMDYLINDLKETKNAIYVGWQSQEEIKSILFAADLAVFPGTHSVLWEQSVGYGIPTVFLKWKGIEHIDLGGNCQFIERPEVDCIKEVLENILSNEALYNRMKSISLEKGSKYFAYSEIARKSIETKG